MTGPARRLGDTLFALFHFGLVLAIAGYAVAALIRGYTRRFLIVGAGLAIYYVFVLHPAVKAEIQRRRRLKTEDPAGRSKP